MKANSGLTKLSKPSDSSEYKETIVTCVGCGKKRRVAQRKGSNVDNFLCQKCAKKVIETE